MLDSARGNLPRRVYDDPMPSALESVPLYRGGSVVLRDVFCSHRRGGAGEEESNPEFGIGFPMAGVFRRHEHRDEALADANHAMLWNRDAVYRVSHPIDGGDATTMLWFSPSTVTDAVFRRAPRDAAKQAEAFPIPLVPASRAAYALVHRLRRLSREPAGREIEIEESALGILDAVVALSRGVPAAPVPARRSDATAVRRRRAAAVREVLAARMAQRVTLDEIARDVAVSPFHLARAFREELGLPIHQYLNRLRLRAALARLGSFGGSFTEIALDSGFASHSHLTDAFRREFGSAPSRFRVAPTRSELTELRKILEA